MFIFKSSSVHYLTKLKMKNTVGCTQFPSGAGQVWGMRLSHFICPLSSVGRATGC